MKRSRYFAKWLIVILIMAIGIGTFGALTISREKEKEQNDARPDGWEADGKGKGKSRYAILDIAGTDNGVTLGYRGDNIAFTEN